MDKGGGDPARAVGWSAHSEHRLCVLHTGLDSSVSIGQGLPTVD